MNNLAFLTLHRYMKHLAILLAMLVLLALQTVLPSQQVSAMQDKTTGTTMSKAVFAGGCFWCMEPPFEKLDGVSSVISGYAGGSESTANYKDVSSGRSKHFEVVEISYDSSKVSYDELVEIFWRQIDPTDASGSFVDRGHQYQSAIFVNNKQEKMTAEKSKASLGKSGKFNKPIATEILPAQTFYPAEDYHQDYYKKNPLRYKYYRSRSGRDDFIKTAWGSAAANGASKKAITKKERIAQLTPLQYKVTQEDATERPFKNTYWDNKEAGLYVDIVSGEPLFSSIDKFKSGTGWPSFTRPVDKNTIVEKTDKTFFMERTEVRSRKGDSHLGHLFDDGPAPTGLRYCINSASLRFIPATELEKEGYSQYSSLFK